MASATTVGAPEGAGASSAAVEPVSQPVSTGAGGAGAGGDGGVLTDDQILGIESPSSSSSQPVPAAQPAATDKPAASAQPAELTIDDFKPLFATNPKLQSLWDKYDGNNKLITQFGTVAEARKAAETVQMLGGVQHLEGLVQKAADVDQTDARFFGGTLEDRKGLANEWYDGEGPGEFQITSQAIAGVLDATLEVMKTRDKDRFFGLQDRLTREALGAEQFGARLAAIAQAFQGKDIPQPIKDLLDWAGRLNLLQDGNARRETPESQRLAAERTRLETERSSWTQQQESLALQTIDTELGNSVRSDIAKNLGELKMPDGRKVFGPNSTKIQETIANQIKATLDEKLATNPVLRSQLMSLRSQGLQKSQKQILEASLRHARLMLPSVIESVVGEWTKSVVSQAAGAADRATRAASRVDVGSGSPPSGATKPQLTLEKLKGGDYKKVSDDDILNA